jgi:ABC-type cobalamin transport system ATPase subunit
MDCVFSFCDVYSKHCKEDRSANDLSTEEWKAFRTASSLLAIEEAASHLHEVKVR